MHGFEVLDSSRLSRGLGEANVGLEWGDDRTTIRTKID